MARHRHNYPPDKELTERCAKSGLMAVAKELGIAPSTLRSYCISRGIESTKQPKPLDLPPEEEAVVELETDTLKQRVKELESALRKDRKEHVYDERVVQAVERNLSVVSPKYKPPTRAKKKQASKTGHEFVLLLSDLHAGENVSREETGGINAYDWEVMLSRLDKLRDSLVSYQDNRPYPIPKLRIFALGDQLSGNIHAELEATNEIPLAEATVQLGADIGEWVNSTTEIFPEVTFDGVVGNHPRAHKKPWAKQGYDNADWTAYHIAATMLKSNKRVTFDIPKASQHRVQVCNRWNALLFHGDGIRSTMPGVPWGGVTRRVNALSAQYNSANMPVDYYFLGHFHQANWVQTNAGWIGMNGSVKGPDEYSLKAFGGGAPAQQMLLTFHPEHGATDCSIIDLT